jgi:uncharacterized protein (DUF433 family)
MNWQDYIVSDKNVMVGRPVIKGTRITVEFLLSLLAAGWDEEKILRNYPTLTKEALLAVHTFLYEGYKDGLLRSKMNEATA